MGGERMVIGNKEKAVVIVLHLNEILQRPEIISKMQPARAANTANHRFHGAKIGNTLYVIRY